MGKLGRGVIRVCGSALAFLAAAGCLDHELAPDDPNRDVGVASNCIELQCIALQSNFRDYEDWMKFDTDVMGEHAGALGTITEYLNELPEMGASEFPVGTMIVKTVQPTEGPAPAIHAMVKRGGTFNKTGALGWEFFELAKNKKGTPIIVWRGAKPPTGERYKNLLMPDSNVLEADCNGCHVGSKNDAILSDALQLDALE
jgi:hypothetical protein